MATVISLVQVVPGIEEPISLSVMTSIPGSSGFSYWRFVDRPAWHNRHDKTFSKIALIVMEIKKTVY
jgi:hypothetical protein